MLLCPSAETVVSQQRMGEGPVIIFDKENRLIDHHACCTDRSIPPSAPSSCSKGLAPSLHVSVADTLVSSRTCRRCDIYIVCRPPLLHAACFFKSRAACLRLKLHSSYARPAPKPTPTNAGHALRLNSSTEKTTPKPRPRVDLTRRFERQRSH